MENYQQFYTSYKGLKFWVIAASFVIVVTGLKLASNLVTVFLIAVFLTAISLSPFTWLRKKKVPDAIALILVIIGLFVILSLFGLLISKTVNGFGERLPFYEEKLNNSWDNIHASLLSYGLIDASFNIKEILKPSSLMSSSKNFIISLSGFIKNPFLVLFIFIFMAAEIKSFGKKLKTVAPESLRGTEKVIKNIRLYFGIKTLTSLATGILVYVTLLIVGVDFALLWGLLAFILNFIPSIGSIFAAVPAVLLAFIQLGTFEGIITGIAYLIINMVIGTFIEPQLMGRNLGLSPFVVFISMIFWGFILGPIGMLISAPLTMILKIIFDSRPNTRAFGALLGDSASLKNYSNH